jgi:hypothetical protein
MAAEPTMAEILAAANSGAGDMATVRAANSYLRIRLDRACKERDAALTVADAAKVLLDALDDFDDGDITWLGVQGARDEAEAALRRKETP